MHQFFRMRILIGLTLLGVVPVLHASSVSNERSGEEVYQAICQYCHETGLGPKLTERQLPAAYIIQTVRYGRGAMPAFRPSEISQQELERTARLIERSQQGAE